ncbi:metallophosphoesterase [Paenibacillus antri]|uniref:metallophosphoesterase n=1 Tax=Paenibacillus antri TaxID=2582848 RepID=UPI001EE3FA90|nr:metallophosphoesterase [Paenibacillus antri]
MIYAALALLCIGVFYFACIFPAQWVEVRRVRRPLGLNVRILQISDLHVEKTWVGPEKLRRLIAETSPDYIFLTGDYTQRLRHLPKVDEYLKAVRDAGVPVYAVLGNHDYRLRSDLPAMLDLFRRRGIPLLRNESLRVGNFRLVGIDDDYSGKSHPRKAFRDALPGERCIVVTHDPTVTRRIDRPYDYLMSGHFHGGQFRVPFVFRLRYKGPLPLQGIVKGIHTDRNGTYYISKGLSQTGLNFRFLIRSEITVHEL